MKRYEQIASDYWDASYSLREPDSPAITCQKALELIGSSDCLRPEEHRLRDLMHVIRFDIIEGNTEWREKQQAVGSVLILPTRG